jgi:ABC-type polysaccharide/polyol phosphate export permease
MMLLLFISPIGFKPEAVPVAFRFLVYMNPVYYMIEMFRASMLYGEWPGPFVLTVYVGMCLGAFTLGSRFFRRFKGALVDYE